MLDSFVFRKLPERLVARTYQGSSFPSSTDKPYIPSSDHMSDAYSSLISELEDEIDYKYPNGFQPPIELDETDDQVS